MHVPAWVLSALASAVAGLVAVLLGVMIERTIQNTRDIAEIKKVRAAYEARLDELKERLDRDNVRLQRAIDEMRRYQAASDGL